MKFLKLKSIQVCLAFSLFATTIGLQGFAFEGAEHTAIGNSITLQFGGSSGQPAATTPLTLPNGLSLTYGQIVALGGDFYGLPDSPISDGSNQTEQIERFVQSFNSLAVNPASVAEATNILQIMQTEINAVNTALSQGKQPSVAAYKPLGDTLSGKWNVATGGGVTVAGVVLNYWIPTGRYLDLATTNWDHFSQHAVIAYQAGHAAALQQALNAKNAATPALQQQGLVLAYAMNAFADHFLSDLFSSGHMRSPRKELYKAVTPSVVGSYLSRYNHDEDCANGLTISNTYGNNWKAFGDKRYFDTVNLTNKNLVNQTVQLSADEVYGVFSQGTIPQPANYAAMNFIPNLTAVQNYQAQANYASMFVIGPTTVERRVNLNNLNDQEWTANWWGSTTLALLQTTYGPPFPEGTIIPPISAPTIASWQSNTQVPPNWVNGNQVQYAVSFTDDEGNESELGPWNSFTTINNQAYPNLQGIPIDQTGQSTGRRVYRQFKNGFPTWVGNITDNVTTTFTDNNP